MRSSNFLLLLFSAVVFAKEEIDCDEIEILKMLSEGCARNSTRFFWIDFQEKISRSSRKSNKKKPKPYAKQNRMRKRESLNMLEKFSCTLLHENLQSLTETSMLENSSILWWF